VRAAAAAAAAAKMRLIAHRKIRMLFLEYDLT